MVKITVHSQYRAGYRVSTGEVGDRPKFFYLEERARAYAERMASFGQHCQLETQRRQNALWTLITAYTPGPRGTFKVVDLYATSNGSTHDLV